MLSSACVYIGIYTITPKGLAISIWFGRSSKILYEALDVWVSAQGGRTTPILNNLKTGLNLGWATKSKALLDLMTQFVPTIFCGAF
jgi:hypothetical protein